LGEVTGVGIGNDALCLVTQCEFGVTEERVVGGSDEPTCHLKDSIGGSGLDAPGQFLGFGFQVGRQRLRHHDLLPE
jgi:hypothetical protein